MGLTANGELVSTRTMQPCVGDLWEVQSVVWTAAPATGTKEILCAGRSILILEEASEDAVQKAGLHHYLIWKCLILDEVWYVSNDDFVRSMKRLCP